ncbi:uncharacterized protein LOC114527503 isoform X2 [Dendronephthya gigantea]|uniref:uncharacterized protein LOC114527503 isoform X2 n=1 Tax=Dendronephthya gigantea TaxID=151771 RepID=UPI00106C006A|nr:uncharacterized protein LOC114527503 isoform X2 [Dendronephthya gigantea]
MVSFSIHSIFLICIYPFGEDNIAGFFIKAPGSDVVTEKQDWKTEFKSFENTSTIHLPSNIQTSQFYWLNSENLCWLDSVMTILVNNRCLELCLKKQQVKNSILQQLFSKFFKAQRLGPKQEGKDVLCEVRRDVFHYLQEKMQCSMGVKDSALVSLNVLLNDCSVISEKFNQECEWTFKCSSCGHMQVNRYNKLVVTFPNTTDDFSMPCGEFLRLCHKCKSPGQRSQLHLTRLPPCVIAHFTEGVKSKNFFESGFVCYGKEYKLCQMIQYKRDPDHFIAWVRNRNGTHWAEIDDTRSVVCKWEEGPPSFSPGQVHIAVWERAKLYVSKSSAVRIIDGKLLGKSKTVLENPKNNDALAVNVDNAESSLAFCKKDKLSEFCCRNPVASICHKKFPENVIDGQMNLVSLCDNVSLDNIRSNPLKLQEQKKEKNDDEMKEVSFNESNSVKKACEDYNNRKRKDSFPPYIPKRKRISPGKDSSDRNTEARFCHNPSDSGYSSPGSNGSGASLPSTLESKEANLVLTDLLETLDDIDGGLDGGHSLDVNSAKESGSNLDSQKSILCCGQNMTKKSTLNSDLKMPTCISNMNIDFCEDFSVEEKLVVKDEDLKRSVESSGDFVDFGTVSDCENNFLNDIEASLNLTDIKINDVAELLPCDDRLTKNRWNEDHYFFDILNEVFPNNLLGKETSKPNSIIEEKG